MGEQSLEKFRIEYEKLHRALKTSYESEKRLVKRCKDLNETILQNAARVKAAIKLTQEDSQTIAILRKEVDKAWKLVEQAKNNEEKARKIISDLKNEISHLSKIVDKGSGLNVGEDNSVTKMMEERANLENEVKQKNEIINTINLDRTDLRAKIV